MGVAITAPHIGWLPALDLLLLLCAAISMALALLSIRLEENYLAIVTIGFGEIVRILLLNEGWLTGGRWGIADIPRPFAITPPGGGDGVILAFAIGLVLVVFVLLELLVRSPFGRGAAGGAGRCHRGIRAGQAGAGVAGAGVCRRRGHHGLAGALHAFYLDLYRPEPVQFPIITAYAFMAVIAGGRGSNLGLLFGAGSIMALLEATWFLKDLVPSIDGAQLSALRLGMIGIGIVLLLILRPQGLVAEPRRRAREFFPGCEERRLMPRVTPSCPTALPPEIAQAYEQFAGGYADFADQAAHAHVLPALDHIYRMLMEYRARGRAALGYIELAVVVVSKLNAWVPTGLAPRAPARRRHSWSIEGLPDPEHEAFDEVDRLVIDYARLVIERAWGIRSGVFTQLRAHFSEAQIVELTLRIALCGFFNRFNDALQIDDGVAEAALRLHPAPSPTSTGEQPTSSSPRLTRRQCSSSPAPCPLSAPRCRRLPRPPRCRSAWCCPSAPPAPMDRT